MITQRQGWLFFPLLTLEGVNLHYLSLRHLFSRQPVKGRWAELGPLGVRFVVVLFPLFLLLPRGIAFASLVLQLAVFGLGGLNYQVEHHLFPSMPRPHPARARRMVRAQGLRLAVPCTETSLWRSYGIVIAYLDRVGLARGTPLNAQLQPGMDERDVQQSALDRGVEHCPGAAHVRCRAYSEL